MRNYQHVIHFAADAATPGGRVLACRPSRLAKSVKKTTRAVWLVTCKQCAQVVKGGGLRP